MVVKQATGDEMRCRTGCHFMNISNKHKETSLAGDHICKACIAKKTKMEKGSHLVGKNSPKKKMLSIGLGTCPLL
jgi:hypothetical protein